jgi:methyl-accepting chemotaxis protein
LRVALASLGEIRGLLLAKDGVTDKLQHVLLVKAKALELNGKLKELVAKQREEGKKGVTSAQAEQAKAVTAVNRIFTTNITTVSVVSVAVLILGIILSTLLARLITTPIKELITVSEKFGHGDFSNKLDESRKDEFGQLAVHFNHATEQLRDITTQIRGAIGNLASNADHLTMTAEALSAGARTQACQTDQSAAAMTEMTQTILDVARNANSAANETRQSLDLAADGQRVVLDTVNGMKEIVESVKESSESIAELGENSAKIGTIVDVITDIADQTNLLALNAAIEAARAGEAGMGFAVVADEVRKLAEKTSDATHEIAGMIRQIQVNTDKSVKSMNKGQEKVEEGMTLASQASGSLEAIVQASNKSVDMVQMIATASEEQSAVASEVSSGMESIATITRKAEASTNEITTAAEELNRLAGELNRMAAWFKV